MSRGVDATYDVVIEEIQERTETDVGTQEVSRDWTFRGVSRCHLDDATRRKTFFASKCTSVVDEQTGEVMETREAVTAWLRQLAELRQKTEHEEVLRGEREGRMAEGLGRDVIVQYAVLSTGETHEFRVTIDVMARLHDTIRF